MRCDASAILEALRAAATETHDRDVLGRAAVAAIRTAMPQASWVGIYWLEGGALVLAVVLVALLRLFFGGGGEAEEESLLLDEGPEDLA